MPKFLIVEHSLRMQPTPRMVALNLDHILSVEEPWHSEEDNICRVVMATADGDEACSYRVSLSFTSMMSMIFEAQNG